MYDNGCIQIVVVKLNTELSLNYIYLIPKNASAGAIPPKIALFNNDLEISGFWYTIFLFLFTRIM
jgi:hypothetical protein